MSCNPCARRSNKIQINLYARHCNEVFSCNGKDECCRLISSKLVPSSGFKSMDSCVLINRP